MYDRGGLIARLDMSVVLEGAWDWAIADNLRPEHNSPSTTSELQHPSYRRMFEAVNLAYQFGESSMIKTELKDKMKKEFKFDPRTTESKIKFAIDKNLLALNGDNTDRRKTFIIPTQRLLDCLDTYGALAQHLIVKISHRIQSLGVPELAAHLPTLEELDYDILSVLKLWEENT